MKKCNLKCQRIFAAFAIFRVESKLNYTNQYPGGYHALLIFDLDAPVESWTATFEFEFPVEDFQLYNGRVVEGTDNMFYELEGNTGSGLPAGENHLDFGVRFAQAMPQLKTAVFNGMDVETDYIAPPPPTVRPTRPPGPPGSYHYDEVIGMSLEFYEAQRSGRLPENNRIVWRRDTFLDDGQREGVDLLGGYFDAGDHVKFGFPFAAFTTILNWGLIDYLQGYESANQKEFAYDTVRWSLDYFIKAHVAPLEFYGQTGDGVLDHAFWGRPEDWPHGSRPSFKITADRPGSELAGETAAAFASGYLVFKDVDPTYAATLLTHATQLYDFAKNYRGVYTEAIPEAAAYYQSFSGYGDELGWSAAWMYRATNDSQYLEDVDAFWTEFNLDRLPEEFGWDDKTAGVQILMAKLTGNLKFVSAATRFCESIVDDKPRTPLGLVYISQWGSLRHASNVAFACLNLADAGINSDKYRTFAKQQIHYILGDNGRSYVCGYGVDPPQRPHHRAASCPNVPSTCDWGNGNANPGPNYQTLYGALVGGPDQNDFYVDDRGDFIHNEVATDYNAGFQGALAALQKLKDNGQLP